MAIEHSLPTSNKSNIVVEKKLPFETRLARVPVPPCDVGTGHSCNAAMPEAPGHRWRYSAQAVRHSGTPECSRS